MTTYYVSSIDGDDTNAGTSSAAAFASLQAAADIVGPGDTVEVMNGTYTSASYGDALDITTSGTQDAPITFEAAAGQSPVIDSSGGWNAIKIEASNIVVSGFTVVGDAATISQSYALANADTGSAFLDGNGITITAGNGVSVPNHIVIENNQVYNEPGGGITSLDADYVTITNNNVHDNAHWSTYGNSGISVGASQNSDTLPGTHFVISGNTSTNNTELVPEYRAGAITDGEGIILDTNPNFVGNYLVEGNTTSGNSGPGIETFMTDNVTIDGNTTSGDLTNPNLASEGEIFVNQSNNNVVTNNSVTPNNDVPPSNAVPTDNSTSSAAPMSNELVLFVSEDAYQGDAEFTVAVNGTQVGGVYTTTALHSQGASQGFDLGTIVNGAIPYDLAVTFINDDFDGTPSTDRNLYVDSVEIDGQAVAGAAAPETGNGTVDFLLGGAAPTSTAASLPASTPTSTLASTLTSTPGGDSAPTPTPSPAASSTTQDLVLNVSEDAYKGNAQFTVDVDGNQVGGTYTATALHGQGQSQAIDLGTFADLGTPHDVAVTFLNDKYDGTPSTDRNLYVDSIQIDGQTVSGTTAPLTGNGTLNFLVGQAAHDLSLNVSEDAYQGDALFTVSVDGKQIGGTDTATALRSQGASQSFDLGMFAGGPTAHDIAVTFLNDAYGGTPSTDRNLYVNSIQIDGQSLPGTSAPLTGDGTQHFSVLVPV